jgi:glycerol uptake facilitator-like aquaporin
MVFLPFAAELLGTFAFLMIILNYPYPLTIGLGLAVIVYVISGISGGHVNPAITTTMWLAGKIDPATALGYIAAQITGGALAYVAYSQIPIPHMKMLTGY